MLVIYSDDYNFMGDGFIKGDLVLYPERGLTIEQRIQFEPLDCDHTILTNCPFIIAMFDRSVVKVYDKENNVIKFVDFQTYGSDFGVIVKHLTSLKSLLPRSVVSKVREKLKESDQIALDFLNESVGSSMEKAYLLRKLAPNED